MELEHTAIKLVGCDINGAQQFTLVHLAPNLALKQCQLDNDGKALIDAVKDDESGLMEKLVFVDTWPFNVAHTLSLLDCIQEARFDFHLEQGALMQLLSCHTSLEKLQVAGAFCILKGDFEPCHMLLVRCKYNALAPARTSEISLTTFEIFVLDAGQTLTSDSMGDLVNLFGAMYEKALLNEGTQETFVKTRQELFDHVNGLAKGKNSEFPLSVVADKEESTELAKLLRSDVKRRLLLVSQGTDFKKCVFEKEAQQAAIDEMKSFMASWHIAWEKDHLTLDQVTHHYSTNETKDQENAQVQNW
eukprot:scaffold220_cov169-Amphora_coffeaeformis.AAC.11